MRVSPGSSSKGILRFFITASLSEFYVGILRRNIVYDFAMNVCQPKITSLKSVGQSFVIHAQLMQNGGIQIKEVPASFCKKMCIDQ